jgi:protein-disulfide isomerase
VSGLGSAPLPPLGPADHVRGPDGAPLVIFYGDFACPACAVAYARLEGLALRVAFRHFPVPSKHPRARVLACAAEAVARQGRFWEFHDSLFADQGRIDDPHLWERVRALGLDVERFEADRRDETVAARVDEDFRGGVRAGVVTTPTLFIEGDLHAGPPAREVLERAAERA